MILIRLILLSAISATVLYNVSAQSTSLKYGDPTKDELGYQVCPFDSSAGAVIFFKYAKMYFLNGQMNYDVHVRMKILKEEGLAAGEIALPYLAENNFEDITNLKAQITHPVSSGKPVVQRVSNFPDETVSKQVKQRKIIFPDVKVGAILEYSFTRKSFNFILPDPWVFDDEYPVLLSFMTAEIPATLNYKAFYEGERAFNAFARTPPIDWTWTLRNLPALRDEPFTDNKLNYANKIILQLAGVHSSTESDGYATKGGYREFNLTWETLAKEFLASDALASYTGRGKPAADALAKINLGDASPLAKAEKIFAYVRDNFSWNGVYNIYPDQNLSRLASSGGGNAAEINLFLYAMLRQAGLEAHPAVTGTLDVPRINQGVPSYEAINHLLCVVNIDKKDYILDATGKFHAFGMPQPTTIGNSCLVVTPDKSRWLTLESPVRNISNYSSKVSVNDLGDIIMELDLRYTGYKALEHRNNLAKENAETWLETFIRNGYPTAIVESAQVINEKDAELPLDLKLQARLPATGVKVMTLNPFALDGYNENPFTASQRRMPVYFGYPFEANHVLMFNHGNDWEVSSIPENIQLSIPGGTMTFMYAANRMGGMLQIMSKTALRSSLLPVESYKPLQGLYAEMVARFTDALEVKRK